MAINRSDTPLADTPEPKGIDPVRTQMIDPDTGGTIYRHTWSNSYGKRTGSPTTKTTTPLVKRESSASAKKPISAPAKKESSKVTTSGSREFTSLPTLTPKGKTDDMKPSAPALTPSDMTRLTNIPKTKEEREKAVNTPSYEKYKKPGQSYEDWKKSESDRMTKNALKNQKKDNGDEGKIYSLKNKSTACKNC